MLVAVAEVMLSVNPYLNRKHFAQKKMLFLHDQSTSLLQPLARKILSSTHPATLMRHLVCGTVKHPFLLKNPRRARQATARQRQYQRWL